MSNWDLMMPGMGLTSIGLAGLVLAYSEIAHTFIDGLHSLVGLTMFIGLIFLAVGILDGGVSTSNRAKATVLVILSISLGFATYALTFNTVSTTGIFAGVLLAIAAPSIIIAYLSMKHPSIVKPISTIFILGSVAGILAFVGFGVYGPSPYLISDDVEIASEITPEITPEIIEEISADLPEFEIAMLEGSAQVDAPDYDPDNAIVTKGHVVVWTNQDSTVHTATSSEDSGDTFDTGLVEAGEQYRLDTASMEPGQYPYVCVVHAWMTSVLVIEEESSVPVSIPQGAAINEAGKIFYDPDVLDVDVGTKVVWTNNDTAVHTVTSIDSDMFDSGIMTADMTFEHVFSEAGEFDYLCMLHPWMTGSVTVG